MLFSTSTGFKNDVSGCFSRCYAQLVLYYRFNVNRNLTSRALCLLGSPQFRHPGFATSWRSYNSTSTTARCAASLGLSSIGSETSQKKSEGTGLVPQPFDFTAMVACMSELETYWVPARVEEVVQYTCHNLAMRLRTIDKQAWFYVSWHPSLGHIGMSEDGPLRPSKSDIYSFGDRVRAILRGLVMTTGTLSQPWERVASFEFAVRPGDKPKYVMHCEIMSRHSNLTLCDCGTGTVLATAHQVIHIICCVYLMECVTL